MARGTVEQVEGGVTLRCEVTRNPCGTDTWAEDYPCHCKSCARYLNRRVDRLRAEHERLAGRVEELKRLVRGADMMPARIKHCAGRMRSCNAVQVEQGYGLRHALIEEVEAWEEEALEWRARARRVLSEGSADA